VRGDIYLEMTYYANAPAPTAAPKNKLLAPAQGSALGRRHSKFSPSDRLSRPIQQNAAGPSSFHPKQPSQLHDQFNSTSSHLNNAVSFTRTNDPLLDLPANEPVHTGAALLNTRHHRSSSLPQAIQPASVPSILRPGLAGRSSAPDVPLTPLTPLSPNPYIGGSSAYTPVQSGLSNVDGTSSNPHKRGSDAYIVEQQVSGGRSYSPAPPGAFISGNQSAPDGRSYSHASRVASPNPYTGSGAFIPGGQQHQPSSGRTYAPTVSVQVSGPYPSPVSPANPYIGSGGVYSPENQLGPNVSSYSPAPATPVQISRSSSVGHSAPTNPYTGGMAAFIPGSQQAPDGWVYSSSPPIDVLQTVGYENHVPSLQANGPSPPYSTGPSGNVSSGSLAFPMPMIPVMEPYEPLSSHYQPPLPPLRTSSLRNNRSTGEIDPYHLARYQTPLPLPPRSVKESSLPPLPPPPPPTVTPAQVSSSPPVAVTRSPVPDTARVEALRKAEQDAARRKEQELKDLELAMQLDRELNL
jgi:hypothetical protein